MGTTVQVKIAHPTDARLTHRAIEKLVDLAKREGVKLRQSFLRGPSAPPSWRGARALPIPTRFKSARRELKFLRTQLGRIALIQQRDQPFGGAS